MLIRSQDKRGFVNLENIDTVCVSSEWEIFAFNNNAKSFIGTYSTEEKAIKVLDMIQDAYVRCESVKVLSSGIMFEVTERIKSQETAEDFKKEHRETFVFQMPQDDEV